MPFAKFILLRPLSLLLLLVTLLQSAPATAQGLRVSDNKRFLVREDGSPFFYLGDTAWELFHRLNREEADRYLENRAEKGFTVIQAVVLAEIDGLRTPNPYGHVPLQDLDPTKPNDAYFQHVDYIVNKATELGIYIGMLPTWGDKVFKDRWGEGPEIFNTQNARIFGEYVGRRYKGKPIIWIMGGDRNPRNDSDVAIWRALAEGVIQGAGDGDHSKVLMTFHPQPRKEGGSSAWFHKDEWLDFNMFQTGHCRNLDIPGKIAADYALSPSKPTRDGEPIYEDHPVCFNAKELGHSEPYDVRKAAYQGLFAGGHGHTYGCHSVWQMWQPGRAPINLPLKAWYESLNLPGAEQMSHVRALMESRPMLTRVPDQRLLTEQPAGNDPVQVTRGTDYLFVYSPQGQPFSMKLGKISGKNVKGYWYDPRTGSTQEIGEYRNKGTRAFTPPSNGHANDWVLILDDSRKPYGAPVKITTRRGV
jgi:hypothetical protein